MRKTISTFALAAGIGLGGCAPSLHPELTRIEIPAQCPSRLLLLPLEDQNDPPSGSGDIYLEAPRVVRDMLGEQLERQGMPTAPSSLVDSLVARQQIATGQAWTRDNARALADSLGLRYVVFGTLRSYYRGSVLGRSTRLAWDLELMDAWTSHPLAHLSLSVSGGQSDPFSLVQETASESARELLSAWDACPSHVR
jgi:hypothetical protein